MFLIKECRDIIVSLNIEIFRKTLKTDQVTPFDGS